MNNTSLDKVIKIIAEDIANSETTALIDAYRVKALLEIETYSSEKKDDLEKRHKEILSNLAYNIELARTTKPPAN